MAGKHEVTRRGFLGCSAAGAVAATIVPRNALGRGETPPSEEFGGALIGCGGRGGGTFGCLGHGVRRLASCDVKYKDRCDNKQYYTDYRRVLERRDIHVVAIATHPGWHALISIDAMEAGKDVVCEKPMTRFIAEGRAVANAENEFGRVFQVERKGGYRPTLVRKIFESGLLKKCDSVYVHRGGFKARRWSGKMKYSVREVPDYLDWNMYCGPTPLRPYNEHRFRGSHRGYWDHEGGGLGDMAHHHLNAPAYDLGRDLTHPVEVIPHAPLAHPEACGLWGWCELKYADGFTLVLDSGEWGEPYPGKTQKTTAEDLLKLLSETDRKKLDEMPEPVVGPYFPEAIRRRVPTGGNAERSHHVATIYHLANIAFRCGRPLKFDPDTEQIVGDEEANRLAYQPMRAPWRI
jgi:hypothetical protein